MFLLKLFSFLCIDQIDDRNFQNINNEEPSDTLDNFHKMEVSRKRLGTAPQWNASKDNLSRHEIEEASDALEFRETELLSKRRELREARAKLTVTEGKLALQLAYDFSFSSIYVCMCIYIYIRKRLNCTQCY